MEIKNEQMLLDKWFLWTYLRQDCYKPSIYNKKKPYSPVKPDNAKCNTHFCI